MKKMMLLVGVLLIFLSSCERKKDVIAKLTLQEKMNAKVAELTEMSELGTVEYTVTKVVKASDDAKWYQFGDRKILFKVAGGYFAESGNL